MSVITRHASPGVHVNRYEHVLIPLRAMPGSRFTYDLVGLIDVEAAEERYAEARDAWKYRQLMDESDPQSDLVRARFYLDRAMRQRDGAS